MMIPMFLLIQAAAAQAAGERAPDPRTPAAIVAAAPTAEWVAIAPADLLVMTLAPAADGSARRVVVQLMPQPFAQAWIGNIRRLAAAHWWDGTSVNRVQDNYVVQWGDATEKKPLPAGLRKTQAADYEVAGSLVRSPRTRGEAGASSSDVAATRTERAPGGWHQRDSFAPYVEMLDGWPIASEGSGPSARVWPVHCYGMVGVGRNVAPDAGTGAELYTVIGQAPRHLDRNIALVGRVIEGIEWLTSLPRGTLPLGFYAAASARVPIVSVRLASELPSGERPRYEYLSTSGPTWGRYVAARANRQDDFFIRPAGAVDICNLPVPIRPSPSR